MKWSNKYSKKSPKSYEEVRETQADFPKKLVPARISRVIALGLQPMKDYKTGANKPPVYQVKVTFEAPSVPSKNNQGYPAWVSKKYNVLKEDGKMSSSTKSAWNQLLMELVPEMVEVVDGGDAYKNMKFVNISEDFDPEADLINKEVMLKVDQTSGGYNKVVSVTGLPDGLNVPELKTPPVFFDYDPEDTETALDKWDLLTTDEVWNLTHNLESGDVYAGIDEKSKVKPSDNELDDDIPF
jgi:hypothetical protein